MGYQGRDYGMPTSSSIAPLSIDLAALEGETLGSLADLVDLAVGHGPRPLAVSKASFDDWDAFESGYALA